MRVRRPCTNYLLQHNGSPAGNATPMLGTMHGHPVGWSCLYVCIDYTFYWLNFESQNNIVSIYI